MDNKYSLGITKVATENHLKDDKAQELKVLRCKNCQQTRLVYDQRKNDHRCESCGEWQHDVITGYATGRSADY